MANSGDCGALFGAAAGGGGCGAAACQAGVRRHLSAGARGIRTPLQSPLRCACHPKTHLRRSRERLYTRSAGNMAQSQSAAAHDGGTRREGESCVHTRARPPGQRWRYVAELAALGGRTAVFTTLDPRWTQPRKYRTGWRAMDARRLRNRAQARFMQLRRLRHLHCLTSAFRGAFGCRLHPRPCHQGPAARLAAQRRRALVPRRAPRLLRRGTTRALCAS